MVTPFDVPARKLISTAAEKLKELPELAPPAWLQFVKSGAHAERAPRQKDFWYVRCASLMRKLYTGKPVGIQRLRRVYGGRKKRGVAREHHFPAGGNILRKALQKLEKLGFVEKTGKGRSLTGKGKAFLDRIAKQVKG